MQTRHSTSHRMMATLVAGLLAIFTATSARPASAVDIVDDPVQMDELLTQVVQATNSLCWEMHRYHQQQPGYPEQYRAAKEIWSRAAQLREALATGPVETDVMAQRANEMSQMFAQLEKSLSQWGPGDRSSLGANATVTEPRTVVRPGPGVDLPFLGVRVGAPAVIVTEEGIGQLQRLRLHPNSKGSKRSLERELTSVKMAISYLAEDAGVAGQANNASPTLAPDNSVVPQPPIPNATLENPTPKPAPGPTPLPTPK